MSELENKLSIVFQALSEESTAKLELQHEVKTLYKEYEIVSGQLKKKVGKLAKLTPRNVTKTKQAKRKQQSAARASYSSNKQNQ